MNAWVVSNFWLLTFLYMCFVRHSTHFCWVPRNGIFRPGSMHIFNFSKYAQEFLKVIEILKFTVPPAVYKGSSCSTLTLTLDKVSYTGGYAIKPYCGFNLHFSDQWCLGNLYMNIGHLDILSYEIYVKSIAHFRNCIVSLFLKCFCILWRSPSPVNVLKISLTQCLPFSYLNVIFWWCKFLILIKSNLPTFNPIVWAFCAHPKGIKIFFFQFS